MLGRLVLFRAATAMNWIYGLEKEGMQLEKDSFISKPTCYITLYSTQTLSYRLVTHARAAAYTKNNIFSAFEVSGIWPLNPHKVFLRNSRNITRFESPPAVEILIAWSFNSTIWEGHKAIYIRYEHVRTHLNVETAELRQLVSEPALSASMRASPVSSYESQPCQPVWEPGPVSPYKIYLCNTPPSGYALWSKKQTNKQTMSNLWFPE